MTQPQLALAADGTQTPATDVYPFTRVFLKMRIGVDLADHLARLGVPVNVLTEDVESAIIARHTQQAFAKGLQPFRYERHDATGHLRADSGLRVFGKDGMSNGTLARAVSDLKEAGYTLNSVKLILKTGDTMYTLQLLFLPTLPGITEAVMSTEIMQEIEKGLTVVWRYIHVYVNPDGSSTINVIGPTPKFQGRSNELLLSHITSFLDALPK